MSTKREEILSSIVTAIKDISGLGNCVFRSRSLAFARDKSPAILIEPVQDQPDASELGVIDWNLIAKISVIVRHNEPDKEADQYVSAIHSKIMDPDFSNSLDSVTEISPEIVTFEFSDADLQLGVIPMAFSIKYRTKSNDLTN